MTVMAKKLPLARLGVVGGGQLARMLAPACNNHDVQMLILDSLNNSPAGQVAFDQIEGEPNDPAALQLLRMVTGIPIINGPVLSHACRESVARVIVKMGW